jgi:alkanesulfonate monooxygenase SsuD/methylene tetrahydromethanopterin reductase-like flavin-dependent oxidoreductase (luciferase family)
VSGFYAVSGLNGFPKPVQRPHPPLLVAGNGRRTVETAAREADILNLMPVSTTSGSVVDDPSGRLPAAMEERIAWVRQVAGGRADRLELSTGMVLRVTDDRRGAAGTRLAGRVARAGAGDADRLHREHLSDRRGVAQPPRAIRPLLLRGAERLAGGGGTDHRTGDRHLRRSPRRTSDLIA